MKTGKRNPIQEIINERQENSVYSMIYKANQSLIYIFVNVTLVWVKLFDKVEKKICGVFKMVKFFAACFVPVDMR